MGDANRQNRVTETEEVERSKERVMTVSNAIGRPSKEKIRNLLDWAIKFHL